MRSKRLLRSLSFGCYISPYYLCPNRSGFFAAQAERFPIPRIYGRDQHLRQVNRELGIGNFGI